MLWFVAALLASFVVGIVAGLFIDHAAGAIPNDRRLLTPPTCPKCGQPWRGAQLLPVVGALWRDKCAECGVPITRLRPMTELATGVLFALAYWRHGPSTAFIFACAFIAVLMVILRIDWRHRLIYPNTVMLGIVLAFAYAAIFSREPNALLWSVVAAVAATLLFLLLYGLALVLYRQRALGFGDVLLAALIGAMAGRDTGVALLIGMLLAAVGGLLLGLLLMIVVFGRRAQKSAYDQMEGTQGAAARALSTLRRGWKTDQLIAFTKQQDMVHRVVGPPGIVLVGEGNPHRLRTLLAAEERRHQRVVADVPIHQVVVGDGEGQVPLRGLVKHVTRLGKSVKGPVLTDVLSRLRAIDANRSNLPIPKGPVPTSMKGLRGQMRGR